MSFVIIRPHEACVIQIWSRTKRAWVMAPLNPSETDWVKLECTYPTARGVSAQMTRLFRREPMEAGRQIGWCRLDTLDRLKAKTFFV